MASLTRVIGAVVLSLGCGPAQEAVPPGDGAASAANVQLSAPPASTASASAAVSAGSGVDADPVLDPSPALVGAPAEPYAAIFKGGAEWSATWKTVTTFYEGGKPQTTQGGGEGICYVRSLSRRKWGLVLETSCSGLTALRPAPFYLATSVGLFVIDEEGEDGPPPLTRSRLVMAAKPEPSTLKLRGKDGEERTLTLEARGAAWCRTERTLSKTRERVHTVCIDKAGFSSGSLHEKPAPGAPTPMGGWSDPAEETFELALVPK